LADRAGACQASLAGRNDGWHSIAEPGFRQDQSDMRFHGRLGDEQPRGDLRAGQAGRQEIAERQIKLLGASQATATTVLAVVPNGGYGRASAMGRCHTR
jgi:hypothetical protein